MRWRSAIPWSLVIFRLALGPTLVIIASRIPRPEPRLGILFLAGPVSDIFDGILARRFGTATPALRTTDTVVDLTFYGFVLIAIVELNWLAIRERMWLLTAVIALEAAHLIFDLVKFRRIASYHSYATKFWGLLLMVAVGAVLGSQRGSWLLTVALAWGILCELEGLAFSAILPDWVHDVKTLPRALVIRREIQQRKVDQVPVQ